MDFGGDYGQEEVVGSTPWVHGDMCVHYRGRGHWVRQDRGTALSNVYPATHGNLILANEWCKEIEKRTNGAVKIPMFPGGTLTPSDQCYDGVVKGISDIGMSVVSYVKGRFPLSEVIDLPLGYTRGSQATRLANEFFEKFKPKEFDDTKVMYLMAHGPGIVHTKKPVEKLEDLKGVKVRGTGTSARVIAALGAVPVAMPMPETVRCAE